MEGTEHKEVGTRLLHVADRQWNHNLPGKTAYKPSWPGHYLGRVGGTWKEIMENDKKKWFHFCIQYRKEEKERINIQVYIKNRYTVKNKSYGGGYKVILHSMWNSPTRNIMWLHFHSTRHNFAKQRLKPSKWAAGRFTLGNPTSLLSEIEHYLQILTWSTTF